MVLDEPNEADEVFDVKGFQFIANKDFLRQAQPVTVDFSGIGFKINSSMDLGAAGCGSCGSGSCS
ncbi:MAG: hypothetical protein GXP53_14365 [Deltaproteobacteria bacterium]|nr:hypothetical protein [Deltaproteobacteria bacterium]